ncbi:hypothetical protein, no similarity [Maudiozyma saulgeensis]|uniref:Uncharacterized protein n=1 Tax=Maudiozyma saulgeensis TaxID=1789683 RepID=A0A1X7R5E4_9SACH|nr:hypothetical protein, no similarity [Kazachstania saulgeensis]
MPTAILLGDRTRPLCNSMVSPVILHRDPPPSLREGRCLADTLLPQTEGEGPGSSHSYFSSCKNTISARILSCDSLLLVFYGVLCIIRAEKDVRFISAFLLLRGVVCGVWCVGGVHANFCSCSCSCSSTPPFAVPVYGHLCLPLNCFRFPLPGGNQWTPRPRALPQVIAKPHALAFHTPLLLHTSHRKFVPFSLRSHWKAECLLLLKPLETFIP